MNGRPQNGEDTNRLLLSAKVSRRKGEEERVDELEADEEEPVVEILPRFSEAASQEEEVVPSLTRSGRPAPGEAAELFAEPAVKVEEEEEPERSPESPAMEDQEGIDDPVRIYLREIGKVYLLSADDEKRLARHMEEAKHVERIEKRWRDEHGRPPTGADITLAILQELEQSKRTFESVVKHLNLGRQTVTQYIAHPTFRRAVDGEMDVELAQRLAQSLRVE